jgi:hypothetical protein
MELEQKLDLVVASNQEYAERVENLEAVVVSQAWEALQKSKGSQAEAPTSEQDAIVPTRPHERPHEMDEQAPEERNRQRAANLARRIGG